MRKVLHYKTNFLNKSETFIDRLIRNHQNYNPVVMCFRKRAYTDGLRIHELPKLGFKSKVNHAAFHLNLSLPWFRKTIMLEKPDLIHTHFGYDSYKLLSISNKTGIPLVTSFYGSDVSRLPMEWGWIKRYQKLAVYGAAFIAASDFMKKQLVGLGFPEHKISIVRFGLNTAEFKYFEGNRDLTSIMMVGRLVEKKGFMYGIKAVSNLINKGRIITLNIFGDGPMMNSLQKFVRELNIQHLVHFHGFQPLEYIEQEMEKHGLLLAPSITASDGDMEGLPNTVLEAMAKGTIVVSSRHAAIPEAIIHGQSGFLTDEKNVNGIAEIIESVLDNNYDINKIRQLARETIEKNYTIETMVSGVENIYSSILSKS